MRIHIGCEMSFDFPQETPLIAMLNVHYSRASDLERPDFLIIAIRRCRSRAIATVSAIGAIASSRRPGRFTFGTDAVIRDPGTFEIGDLMRLAARGAATCRRTRCCSCCPAAIARATCWPDEAWRLFGHTPLGWPRVQAVCDFVHNHIVFSYGNARPTRTAAEAYREQSGVCRDFAHLAVTFCRALNIPTRYCTGYISDIGLPKPWCERWISPPGWRSISAAAGTPSTRATMRRASAAS